MVLTYFISTCTFLLRPFLETAERIFWALDDYGLQNVVTSENVYTYYLIVVIMFLACEFVFSYILGFIRRFISSRIRSKKEKKERS